MSFVDLHNERKDNAIVVYIGEAGSATSQATLFSPLIQYLKFGQGSNVEHYGGRLIWQLNDSRDLLTCFKTLPHNNSREIEQMLIEYLKQKYNGKRSFANLQL